MSDRIADHADELRTRLEENILPEVDGETRAAAERAADELQKVAVLDRRENGPTPTDKLAQLAEGADDHCVICGEPTDGAVFCSWSCLKGGDDE